MTSSPPSGAKSAPLNADEIRRLVQLGKDRGLVRAPGEARPIDTAGAPAVQFDGVRSQWLNLTPELARRWLDNNFRNRPVAEDTVTAYARDMAAGLWVATHQGIAFNDRDELIDGQHRLLAILASGATVRMMVTWGLPSAVAGREMTTMDAVDRGRPRSVADQLKIQHGLKDGSQIAQVTAALARLCQEARTRRLSVGQTLDIYRAFAGPINFVIAHRSKEPGLRQAGLLAAFAFAGATEDGFAAGAGWHAAAYRALLDGGEKLTAGKPLTQLRAFLTSDEAKLLNRGTDRGVSELVLQALWLARQERCVKALALAQDGADDYRGRQAGRVAKISAMFALPEKAA